MDTCAPPSFSEMVAFARGNLATASMGPLRITMSQPGRLMVLDAHEQRLEENHTNSGKWQSKQGTNSSGGGRFGSALPTPVAAAAASVSDVRRHLNEFIRRILETESVLSMLPTTLIHQSGACIAIHLGRHRHQEFFHTRLEYDKMIFASLPDSGEEMRKRLKTHSSAVVGAGAGMSSRDAESLNSIWKSIWASSYNSPTASGVRLPAAAAAAAAATTSSSPSQPLQYGLRFQHLFDIPRTNKGVFQYDYVSSPGILEAARASSSSSSSSISSSSSSLPSCKVTVAQPTNSTTATTPSFTSFEVVHELGPYTMHRIAYKQAPLDEVMGSFTSATTTTTSTSVDVESVATQLQEKLSLNDDATLNVASDSLSNGSATLLHEDWHALDIAGETATWFPPHQKPNQQIYVMIVRKTKMQPQASQSASSSSSSSHLGSSSSSIQIQIGDQVVFYIPGKISKRRPMGQVLCSAEDQEVKKNMLAATVDSLLVLPNEASISKDVVKSRSYLAACPWRQDIPLPPSAIWIVESAKKLSSNTATSITSPAVDFDAYSFSATYSSAMTGAIEKLVFDGSDLRIPSLATPGPLYSAESGQLLKQGVNGGGSGGGAEYGNTHYTPPRCLHKGVEEEREILTDLANAFTHRTSESISKLTGSRAELWQKLERSERDGGGGVGGGNCSTQDSPRVLFDINKTHVVASGASTGSGMDTPPSSHSWLRAWISPSSGVIAIHALIDRIPFNMNSAARNEDNLGTTTTTSSTFVATAASNSNNSSSSSSFRIEGLSLLEEVSKFADFILVKLGSGVPGAQLGIIPCWEAAGIKRENMGARGTNAELTLKQQNKCLPLGYARVPIHWTTTPQGKIEREEEEEDNSVVLRTIVAPSALSKCILPENIVTGSSSNSESDSSGTSSTTTSSSSSSSSTGAGATVTQISPLNQERSVVVGVMLLGVKGMLHILPFSHLQSWCQLSSMSIGVDSEGFFGLGGDGIQL